MHSLLIVDDEPFTREFMSSNISSIDPDWAVAGEAQDGIEALEFLEKQKVDLVITDIKMPGMNGLELCEKIRNINKQQEIVILSGYDEFSFAQEAMKYQVHGYLLKPIKIASLKDMLSEITQKIDARCKEEIAYNAVKSLSVDYQSHIYRAYLRAIIQNSQTEIRSLHPMIYKMKVDLVQTEGIIMILKLDIESIINQKLPLSDLNIFQYILFQKATEIIKEYETAMAILDSDENTVVYITSDNPLELEQKCTHVYLSVSSFLKKQAGLTVTGSIGSARSDILEMYSSYMDSLKALQLWAVRGGNSLYRYGQIASSDLSRIDTKEKYYTAIITCLIENNETGLYTALNNYINTMENLDTLSVVRHMLLLLGNIKKFKSNFTMGQYELCLNSIASYVSSHGKCFSEDDAFNFFLKVISPFSKNASNSLEEPSTQKLIKDSMDFIYQHFSEPITLSQIADSLQVSPNYLSKIFHESVGLSYIKFITKIRMEYATKLLKSNPNEKISNIAEKTGYYNLKHFYFVFKEYYNMTPSEYQKS